ncbi:MAG: pyridoxal 5'-phosphate synthase glutaminase subunit PdxT [Candidatus Micrarchaeota archaeon]
MRVGVLGLQGDVSEHMSVVSGLGFRAVWVKDLETLHSVGSLIIPGGESTTISDLLIDNGLFQPLRKRALAGMPVFGTCAGAILLAKDAGMQQRLSGQRLLGLMDMSVDRNAYGRQRESFEAEVNVIGVGRMHAPFIRAPVISRVRGECRAVAVLDGEIVAARQGSLLAACFHPELSGDSRMHRYFLLQVAAAALPAPRVRGR